MNRFALAVAAFAGIAASSQSAFAADFYAFGYSNYDGAEALSVTTGTGSTSISTHGFQGWVSDTAVNTAGPTGSTNYAVGNVTGHLYNNYFVFDISGLTGTVTSAVLSLTQGTNSDSAIFRLGDATNLISSLHNAVSPNVALYNALGTGTLFGTYSLSAGTSYNTLAFTLNQAGINALNADIAAGKTQFALGGSITSLAGSVPEASTWAMLIVGIGGVGSAMRKRKKVTSSLA